MIIEGKKLQTTKCKNVSIPEGLDIIKKLEEELLNSNVSGIGLAAPQIGIDASVFILRFPRSFNPDPYADLTLNVINPEIKDSENLSLFKDEGCLSFAGKRVTTKRYENIYAVDALHEAGVILTGMWSVAYQHEFDHTLGLTMYNKEVKLRPNDQCFCGSGKKYKKCCINKFVII